MNETDYLLKKLREEVASHNEFIAKDNCKDFAHYKYLCGLIRGLEVAQSHVLDLAEKLKND
jgi:hypothetical protein